MQEPPRLHRLDTIDDEGLWTDPPAQLGTSVQAGPVLDTFPDAKALIPEARRGAVDGPHAVVQARWRRPLGHGHEVRGSLAAVLEVRSTGQES